MSINSFLIKTDLPFCKGCGHHFVARHTATALEKMGLSPLDVIIVTDIGCHGIVDASFGTHTVHGLHGRSSAIAAGIAMGVKTNKKVIVFLGDGGVTIGMQHLLEAARMNLDMTVVVHNNLLYGMTGGQNSGLTFKGYHTATTPEGNPYYPYNICEIIRAAGAPYVSRFIARGDFSENLKEAFEVQGFSFVEILELCPSYGAKFNPGVSLKKVAEESGFTPGVWRQERGKPFKPRRRETVTSLLEDIEHIDFSPAGKDIEYRIILGGSAGGGVQKAASLLAETAITEGLYSSKKGSYPVTVGVGFSNAEIIISSREILYHGITKPDAILITTEDGLQYNRSRLNSMQDGTVFIHENLEFTPENNLNVIKKNYYKFGARQANLLILLDFLKYTGIIPPEKFIARIQKSLKLNPDTLNAMLNFISES